MLVKRIKTKTRTSTDIPLDYNWDGRYSDIDTQVSELSVSLIESGIVHSLIATRSQDELTETEEMQFTSLENCMSYEKQINDLEYSNGSLLASLQYMLDNGITHTVSYIFEK